MKRVLIVEDEFGNREVMQLLLEAEGYSVATAANGREALALLAGDRPAVILSDFMMPIMNGAELGEAVRRDETLRDIPFVIISATSEDVVRRGFRDYDMFVTKPISIDPLLQAVERLVASGRPTPPSDAAVGESMRQLLKGIELPPFDGGST